MTCGLVHATGSYRLPEWQGVKMTFFAPWRYTVFMYTCKWNPLKGVWHPSEGGTLHLCIIKAVNQETLKRSLTSLRRRYTSLMYKL